MTGPFSRRALMAAGAAWMGAPAIVRAARPVEADVVVIGAGAAGLAAARALRAGGRRVVVLEARNRIGGRAHTDTSALGLPFDRGAHWLHSAEVNPFLADARRLGRRTWLSGADGLTLLRAGRPLKDGEAQLEAAMAQLERRVVRRSLLGVDFALGQAAGDELQQVAAEYAAFTLATDRDRLSVQDFGALADGEDYVVEGGFGQLVADLAADVPVRTGHGVQKIDWRASDRVRVLGAFGALDARQVVITVPPPVLASGAIAFDPPLPVLRQAALDALQGGAFIKVGLRLDRPLTQAPEFAFDMDAALRHETTALYVDPRLPLATVIFSGRHARTLSRAGPGALTAAGREALVAMLGSSLQGRITATTVADWTSDPFALGAYSVVKVGQARARQVYGTPIDHRLFFAGDSDGKAYAVTVMGARRSGEAAARAILARART